VVTTTTVTTSATVVVGLEGHDPAPHQFRGFASNLLDAASVEAVYRLYNGLDFTCQVADTAMSEIAVEDLCRCFLAL
jgi:hypothetical protein